ncbi:MAG: glutathionylspermidine synthase family protein [Eubacteriales bacterium]|jgi:glutathionylspermidine synthase
MEHRIKFGLIPEDQYTDYRYNVIFNAYKWDPQVEDHNTVAKQVLLIDKSTANQLEVLAEQLSEETMQMEEAMIKNLPLAKELGLPKDIRKSLSRLAGYNRESNVRLMRFDFHPTTAGWAVSEVNSDVPGGIAEASVLPVIASKYFEGYEPRKNIADILLNEFKKLIGNNGTVAFIHATSYADDRQVMEFIGDYFKKNGFNSIMASPDHIVWKNKKAISIIQGQEGEVDGIIRFFPLEWLANLPKSCDWKGFYDCTTPSCNHPVAILTQPKRLPLVWDKLNVDVTTWKKLLPQTINPKSVDPDDESWIFKPSLGRVGEGISIKEAVSEKELRSIKKSVKRHPNNWIAQQKFISQPIVTNDYQTYHVCIGVFTVNGKSAGFYGRISPFSRIDGRAKDIPILVSKGD